MSSSNDSKQNQIENLINSAWSDNLPDELLLLRTKFDEKLEELDISSFQAEKNLEIEYKTLNRILDGQIKKFDLIPLLKLGYFLGIPEKEMNELFTRQMASQNSGELEKAKKSTFILNEFDLALLKNLGVINSISDFDQIETQLKSVLGLDSILDYSVYDIGAAMSSTRVKPKNERSRRYFQFKSRMIFKKIDNPNRYDKQALIDYFPKIRWHSTDMNFGLPNVIKSLFELGVTVIYQPRIPLLQMRGATFEVNGKPCIVLTDYRNAYPTLWFAFIHELFHVLFDWEEILQKRYHLSDEENDLFVLQHKEAEANEFAREYLFPQKKLDIVAPRIKQASFIKEYALDHHVHPSIVYSNYAHSYSSEENNAWAQLDKLIRPPMSGLIEKLCGGLNHEATVSEFANFYLETLYKTNINE